MSTIRFSGMASGIDTESMVTELMKAEETKMDNLEKDLQMLEWQKEAWEEANAKIYEFYTNDLYKMKQQSTYMKNNATVSDTGIMQVTAGATAIKGVHGFNVTQLAKGSYLTGKLTSTADNSTTMSTLSAGAFASSDDITLKVSTDGGTTETEVTINKDDTMAEVVEKLNTVSGINVSFDDEFDTLFFATEDTGADQTIQINTSDADGDQLLQAFGFGLVNTATGTTGDNLQFTYQGETFETSDNNVSINGMEISFTGTGTTNVVIEQDVDAIYNEIKSFIESYNELITYINEKVYADDADGYEPLTDEEKESMTDDQIEIWEDTIKDSLLRRDSTLMSLTTSMREDLTNENASAGSTFESLSMLGIVTGDYTERGLLHINGDEDDPLYGALENDLKEAIESDPEEVAKLFSQIAEDIYNDLTDRMASTDLSSAFTIYNDKQMDSDIEDIEDEMEDMEDYLIMIEDRYYSQFTAMEQAIMQLNQQSASLTSMLGGS
ncbi:flagellar filament capping protein FliD [Vallitalea okinawensis]|uniref:flagellar filament capping protein FliD n=1 Tax=Vallitalea okinawensis TaxID=2078660 RepID=UPI000CFABFAA|nr:flagellar filament capping protein FliD [Vallitalea okinawensis]